MASWAGRRPMTDAVRARMLRRIAERGERGMWRSWIQDRFYGYLGWDEALSGLVESGLVERREVVNPIAFGVHRTSTIYFTRGGGERG